MVRILNISFVLTKTGSPTSVSYTHLDVYKRQVQHDDLCNRSSVWYVSAFSWLDKFRHQVLESSVTYFSQVLLYKTDIKMY